MASSSSTTSSDSQAPYCDACDRIIIRTKTMTKEEEDEETRIVAAHEAAQQEYFEMVKCKVGCLKCTQSRINKSFDKWEAVWLSIPLEWRAYYMTRHGVTVPMKPIQVAGEIFYDSSYICILCGTIGGIPVVS